MTIIGVSVYRFSNQEKRQTNKENGNDDAGAQGIECSCSSSSEILGVVWVESPKTETRVNPCRVEVEVGCVLVASKPTTTMHVTWRSVASYV